MSAILELRHITKVYPGVTALDDFSMAYEPGKIHSIMGENGAGKSTLIKIVTGAVEAASGTVVIDGREFQRLSPGLSMDQGVGAIYQEFNLVPTMSVAENIFLGLKTGGPVMPDFRYMRRRSSEIMAEFGMDIDPNRMVGELSTARQQLVEIAKAVSRNCKILILDEPTASIAIAEAAALFRIIRALKDRGTTIMYISHRMDEIFELSDTITVMRDGRLVGRRDAGEATRQELIRMMVGRELTESFPPRKAQTGETVLEVRDLCGNGDFHISFSLHKGEILGLGGLVGAGRTELAKMLAGEVKPDSGEIVLRGKPLRLKDSSGAIVAGIGLAPEDRKKEGAFLNYTIGWNISIMSLKRLSRAGVVNLKKLDRLADEYIASLRIKTPSPMQLVRNLSGGNQQKVVVAKVLAARTSIIIFDEPTRGIDVGAKQEIYQLMNSLAEQGMAIIMISSEMEELLGMSDRIIVLYEGKISGELQKENFSQEQVLEYASGM